jgi:phosphoribosylglycinamide formyltransferase-1
MMKNKNLLTNIGVLGSTRGTILSPIVDSINEGILKNKAKIVVCISNKKNSGILQSANNMGIKSIHIPVSKNELKEDYDSKISKELVNNKVDLIICVGWMRILSKLFTDKWNNCCMNVHPSLLPEFAGGMDTNVHQEVLDSKKKITGCTIHMVSEEIDGGLILIQKECNVLDNDNVLTLKNRVQKLESEAYIEAILKWKKIQENINN